MVYTYTKYKSSYFSEPPATFIYKGFIVEYLSFCRPENSNKIPLLYIGGAFQNFNSFRTDVRQLVSDYPIILVDLPGQGSNRQLSASLNFTDFADLLKEFLISSRIFKIILIGLSYGTAIANAFVASHSQFVHKLILGGVTARIRDALAVKLKLAMEYAQTGNMQPFADGVTQHLFNYPMKEKIGLSNLFYTNLAKAMTALDENSIQRYIDNTTRLLELTDLQYFSGISTLVFVGEYDNFTTPNEAFHVAKNIPEAIFTIIKNADHLVPIEQPSVLTTLYRAFIEETNIKTLQDVISVECQDASMLNKRLFPRYYNNLLSIEFLQKSLNKPIQAELFDLSVEGCLVWIKAKDIFEPEYPTIIRFPEMNISLNAVILGDLPELRCIFCKDNTEQYGRFLNEIKKIATKTFEV